MSENLKIPDKEIIFPLSHLSQYIWTMRVLRGDHGPGGTQCKHPGAPKIPSKLRVKLGHHRVGTTWNSTLVYKI